MANDILTQDYLKSIFEYRDGELYWKIKPRKGMDIGGKAGSKGGSGYQLTKINNKSYRIHRLIYLFHHGILPKAIDHIDCNKNNNKIENLRAATLSQNQQNKKLNKNNKSGIKNVTWVEDRKKWAVSLGINGKSINFGRFKDVELAELVAIMAREKYHGNFANHGKEL